MINRNISFCSFSAVGLLRSGEKTPQQVKEMLISRVVQILTAYRKHCAQPGSSLGQLILPEALKLLPVYLTGALKCDAIDGGPEMMVDDKALAQLMLLGAHPSLSQVTLYPKLLAIQVCHLQYFLSALLIKRIPNYISDYHFSTIPTANHCEPHKSGIQ